MCKDVLDCDFEHKRAVCICMNVFACVYRHVYVGVCTLVCVNVFVYALARACMCVCMYECVCVCFIVPTPKYVHACSF